MRLFQTFSKYIFFSLCLGLLCVSSISCASCKICTNFPDKHWPKYFEYDRVAKEEEVESLKVVSFNTHYDHKVDDAIQMFKEHPDLNDADFILLQEKDAAGTKKFAHALGYNYVYYPASIHKKFQKEFGNAVLSKWPILDDEKIILSGREVDHLMRIAVGITANVRDKEVKVYSVHQNVMIKSRKRKSQLENLLNWLPKSSKYVIVGGDFNTYTKRNLNAAVSAFEAYDYDYATKNAGWTFRILLLLGKTLVLDQIYTKGFGIEGSGRVVDLKASDHVPIWTVLEMDGKEDDD